MLSSKEKSPGYTLRGKHILFIVLVAVVSYHQLEEFLGHSDEGC
jgi:hypothetical protein